MNGEVSRHSHLQSIEVNNFRQSDLKTFPILIASGEANARIRAYD